MDLDEARILDVRPRRRHGRIESLAVPDRQHHAAAAWPRRSAVGFGDGLRQRLLDQRVDARLDQRQRNLRVALGRHGDHGERRAVELVDGPERARCRARAAICAARSRLMSTTPASETPGSDARIRA